MSDHRMPMFGDQPLRTGAAVSAVPDIAARQRVMRNTYWLLALSLVPTVLGAWLGVTTGALARLGPGLSAVLFLGGAFGFIFGIERTKNSGAGVALLLAFTFFMGLMLSRMLSVVLGWHNGASLVMTAFGGTAAVLASVAMLSTVIKRDLSGMGRFLFAGVIVLLVAGLANAFFFHSSALMLTMAVLSIGIFSAFLLFDMKRVLDGGETNYITATLAIYLDLFNIFQSLLAILGIAGRDD